jgi:RNA polymerase sigma-70 factor, ECF subfamily
MGLDFQTQAERDQFVRAVTSAMTQGSDTAFTSFFNLVFDRLFRSLLVQTKGDEDLSKELTQIAMIRAVKYIQPFENERILWGWLRQIARSVHIDWLRKKGREPQCVSIQLMSEATAEAESDDGQLQASLESSIQQLEPDEREVLRLAYFEGVSQQSMADKLHTTVRAVESKLRRIRQKLRRILLEKLKEYALF